MSRCVAALKYSDMNDAMHGWMRLNRSLRYSKYNYACIFTTFECKSYNKFDNSELHSNVASYQ